MNRAADRVRLFVAAGLLAATFGVVAGAAQADDTSCSAGYYLSTGLCVAAPPGYFSLGGTATEATACPEGTYQPSSGQPSCFLSDMGHYAPGPAATQQLPCELGTYQPFAQAASCFSAPPGWYVDVTGAVTPFQCQPGTYQPLAAQPSCLQATPGHYAAGLANEDQTSCSPGTYQDGFAATACIAAPPGSYVDQIGAAAPTLCAAGTYQPEAGQLVCISAPVDYYVPVSGATEPTPCPANTHQPQTGQASCITDDPELTVHDAAAVNEPDKGVVYAEFAITLNVASAQPVSVRVETLPGTAEKGKDFAPYSKVITFAPGETSKTVSVLVHKDGKSEPLETFSLVLGNATGALIADGTGIGTINAN